MRVRVEVTGRPLFLHGALHHVGERRGLDTADHQHAEALASGWARPLPPETAGLAQPLKDKMVHGPDATRGAPVVAKQPPKKGKRT